MYEYERWALYSAAMTIVGLILLMGVLPARAQVELKFDTLPSAQGWTYTTSGPAESDIFSVDGTTLHQNSIGTGLGAGGTAFQYYILPNVVDPTKPFTVNVRARVLQSETDELGGFSFGVFTGSEIFEIFMDTSTIWDAFGTTISTVNTTDFHDYRLEGAPGVGYKFFVDDSLVASGLPNPVGAPNQLFIGDGTSGGNARADVTFYRFQLTTQSALEILDTSIFRRDGGDGPIEMGEWYRVHAKVVESNPSVNPIIVSGTVREEVLETRTLALGDTQEFPLYNFSDALTPGVPRLFVAPRLGTLPLNYQHEWKWLGDLDTQ